MTLSRTAALRRANSPRPNSRKPDNGCVFRNVHLCHAAHYLQSRFQRPGPLWNTAELYDAEDPALYVLAPPEGNGIMYRTARAALLIIAVLILSPVVPALFV